jgi:hypothetical protein
MLAGDGGKVDGLVNGISVVCLMVGLITAVSCWVKESRGRYSTSSLREWETLCYIERKSPLVSHQDVSHSRATKQSLPC